MAYYRYHSLAVQLAKSSLKSLPPTPSKQTRREDISIHDIPDGQLLSGFFFSGEGGVEFVSV